MQAIIKTYKLNKYKNEGLLCGPSDVYLGAHIWRHWHSKDDSNSFFCAISVNHYVNNAIENLQKKLIDHSRELNNKQQYPFFTVYFPELDTLPELDQ